MRQSLIKPVTALYNANCVEGAAEKGALKFQSKNIFNFQLYLLPPRNTIELTHKCFA